MADVIPSPFHLIPRIADVQYGLLHDKRVAFKGS